MEKNVEIFQGHLGTFRGLQLDLLNSLSKPLIGNQKMCLLCILWLIDLSDLLRGKEFRIHMEAPDEMELSYSIYGTLT